MGLLHDLAEALEGAGVAYCDWKGNVHRERSSRTDGDVDLLVRRGDVDAFGTVVHRLGFKEVRRRRGDVPGVVSYYGYDAPGDRLVHLHVHYQLVFGDQTANYRVPLEEPFLLGASTDGTFPVPPVELEFIVFVIRMVVTHCTWEALVLGDGRLPPRRREELALLRARVDGELVQRSLEQHLPSVDSRLFADCVRALDPGAGIRARMRVARRLLTELDAHARRGRAADVCLKLWRRSRGSVRRRLSRPSPRKRFAAGGAMIAVVAADGGGKTTLVDALYEWLAKDFAVTKVHLGKPPWSWRTWLVRGLLKVRAGLLALRGRDRSSSFPEWNLPMLLPLATARDRYRTYSKARRFSLDGGLVICDRFPLAQLTLMDAPRIERRLGVGGRDRLGERLSRLEQRFYHRLAPPDVLVVLRVDPETAVKRKPDEEPDFVRSRWSEIWSVDWEAIGAHVVDAHRSQDEVLLEVKSLLWSKV